MSTSGLRGKGFAGLARKLNIAMTRSRSVEDGINLFQERLDVGSIEHAAPLSRSFLIRVSRCSSYSTDVKGEAKLSPESRETLSHEAPSKFNHAAEVIRLRRKAYDEQLSELRKRFAAERAEKERQSAREQKQAVEEQVARKAVKVLERKDLSVNKQQEAAVRLAALREEKLAEFRLRAERKSARDEQWKKLLALQQEELRKQSAEWIEDKELERRILVAMVDQRYL